MENNHHDVILRKIPLSILLDHLTEIYNSGVDYIDILGVNGEEQDRIGIAFNSSYMSPEEDTNLDQDESQINIKLSDEDLNQLL
jgi:hypothetical protein